MKVLIVLLVIIFGIGFFFLGSWILMLLWNWLLPYLPVINIWQAAGIGIFCEILFGGTSYTSKFKS